LYLSDDPLALPTGTLSIADGSRTGGNDLGGNGSLAVTVESLHIGNVSTLFALERGQLLNRLNVIHFQDGCLFVVLRHRDHDHTIRLQATPHPAEDEHIKATWHRDAILPPSLQAFALESIIVPGPKRTFSFLPERYWVDTDAIRFELPDGASEIDRRKNVRYDCRHRPITVTLAQHFAPFAGTLLEYSSTAMLVELHAGDNQSLHWLNQEAPATLTLGNGQQTFYSGPVKFSSRDHPTDGGMSKRFILEPTGTAAPRFSPKKYRARREVFSPSPDFVFTHPITGRRHALKVHDLGSLGFAVDETEETSVLIPGLLLPATELSFANSLCLTCTVQVVYRNPAGEGKVRCGIAILDIKLQDHLKLISLIQQVQDPHAYISNRVDPEDLFEFFFETGFLYPHKYAEIAGNREAFRKAYSKLYDQGTDVARHFVYQENGRILGHLATLRVFDNTWLNHHHAAIRSSHAGLKVVRAISEFINDSYLLNPANLKYMIGFYRSENKFPEKYFGGFVRQVRDAAKSSLDVFSYLNQASSLGYGEGDMAGEWELSRAVAADIIEFRGYYLKASGGLLADAMDLTLRGLDGQKLAKTYEACGLQRQRHLYAIRHQKVLKALVDVQDSDLGLNLSELTNAIIVYIIDEEAIHREMLQFIVSALAIRYNKLQHPLLIYPNTYAAKYRLPVDKEYTLWALDLIHGGEDYMSWMQRFCRG
jgi:hypothetical protein